MNTFETIPLDHVRDRIKLFYDIQHTRKDMFIDLMIMNAVGEINSYMYTENKCVTLDICDHKAQLPCDYKIIISLVSDSCDDCGSNFMYQNFTFNGDCCVSSDNKKFKIQQGYIMFPHDFDGTQVDMYYTAYVSDEHGFPFLKKAHIKYYVDYVGYWLGMQLEDARVRAFLTNRNTPKYINTRRNIIHNENVDETRLNMPSITATMLSLPVQNKFLGTFFYQSPYSNT